MKDLAREVLHKHMETAMENLRRNRMEAYFVSRKEDVVPQVRALLRPGDTVGRRRLRNLEGCWDFGSAA